MHAPFKGNIIDMFASNDSIHQVGILSQTSDPETIREKLTTMAHSVGLETFRKQAAREIVNGTQPERAIPDVYQPYRPLVRDGIQFFLSHLSLDRLVDVIVHQLSMDRGSVAEERLLELAKQFPTLHKLGQIIVRNQHIDPMVKHWLIHLENGKYGTAPETLLSHIRGQLKEMDGQHRVDVDSFIMAEASVGAVIPFRWTPIDNHAAQHGVFKVLKPKIEEKLEEELIIFGKMATFFEKNRQRYALSNFRFLDVFEDVRIILKREINLETEQTHLKAAFRFFNDTDEVVIPSLMPLCEKSMTAMAHIEGEKITDADLTAAQRKACAHMLVDALICRPLFATQEPALFHGDPHAGNILALTDDVSRPVKVALLDWSLAGHLTQRDRKYIVRLIQGLLIDDLSQICHSIQNLTARAPGSGFLPASGLGSTVSGLMQSDKYADFSLIKKAFWLMEQLSYEGVVFPSDLLLFRKAIFTLEGVLFDLYPQFDMDIFIFGYMAGLLADEMPLRLSSLLFSLSDKPENYRCLLSNKDLLATMTHQFSTAYRRNTNTVVELLEKQTQIINHLFIWPFAKAMR